MDIRKKFAKYVSQNIFGMLGISCYVVADTFFISKFAGADGITVLYLVLPVFNVIFAVGSMIGVGSAIRFKILRAKNNERADDYFSKVQFKITADHDIYDSVSLEKLYSKGDAVTTDSGKGSNDDTVKLLTGTELGNGIYTPDKDGKLELSGLPMGTYACLLYTSPSPRD